MNLIAHRGWRAGAGENTLAALARAAGDERIAGVEFDVRYMADHSTLVLSHDPPANLEGVLTLDAALAFLAGTDLELFIEIKEPGIAALVIAKLVASKMADRSVVFGFPPAARTFPWHGPRPVRLGIIILYPWSLNRIVAMYRPDVLFLGWDYRPWTRRAFQAWWSVFSLERRARRHQAPIVVGIVERPQDLRWLARRRIYGAVADFETRAEIDSIKS